MDVCVCWLLAVLMGGRWEVTLFTSGGLVNWCFGVRCVHSIAFRIFIMDKFLLLLVYFDVDAMASRLLLSQRVRE